VTQASPSSTADVLFIDLPYACYWVEVDDNGRVYDAPPIARWMIGEYAGSVWRWVERKGGTARRVSLHSP
jgi:hypothetical protein